MGTNPPRYVTSRCQHCDNGIEFDANVLEPGETRLVDCPHCHRGTTLSAPKPVPTPKPAKQSPKSEIQNFIGVTRSRPPSRLGIASLVLGVLGFVICLIPFVRFYAIPVALAGSLLALVGAFLAIKTQKTGFSFLVGGAVACLLTMLIAAFILIRRELPRL